MKGTTVITDFKDLKKAIIEVTKNKPAKSREQLQYEKMQPLKEGKNLMPGIDNIVKTKGAKKVGGVTIDMFTASMIQKVYDRVNDKNKKRMEKAPIGVLVKIAQTAMNVNRKDMMNSYNFNETVEGFASDAQRRAAFASGYKAKGKKGKKESVNESEFHLFSNKKDAEKKAKEIKGKVITGKGKSQGQFMAVKESFDEAKASYSGGFEKGRGPTGISYSIPQGHPDAENPKTRKKYPERQTKKYKKDYKALLKKKNPKVLRTFPVNEAKVLRFTKIVDKSLEKHLKFVTKKIGADMKKIPGGFEVGGTDDRGLNSVIDYVFDKSIKKGLLDGGGMSQVNLVKESMADFMSGVIKVQQSYSDVKKAENMLKMFARDGLIGYNGPMRGQVGSDSFIIVGKKKDVKLVLNKMSRIASTPVKELPMPKIKLVKADVVKEDSQDLQEGTWKIPDNKRELALMVDMLAKPFPATKPADINKFLDMFPVGDDILYDDLSREEYETEPDGSLKRPLVKVRKFPKVFLNVIAGESLSSDRNPWIRGKTQGNKFIMTHHSFGPEASMENVKVKEIKQPKRKSGNIRKARMMKLDLNMGESFVTNSPFKLKSKQYPRAIGVDTEGYGVRHASRDDIVEACESFGMITEKELQIEQIQKELGKQGFLSYNISELVDVFDERETERMILALESHGQDLEPIDYNREQIDEAIESDLDIDFVRPDGMKSRGPILKMCENTYNVKDKHTGKSYTFKYKETGVKTYRELISEAKFSAKLVKQAGGIAFDKRYYQGNYSGAVKAIEKLKKGLSDDPRVQRLLKIANEQFDNPWYNALSEDEKTEYQKFFQKAMKKFGIKSPAELKGPKEKEFYNYVDANWKGKGEKKEDKELNPSRAKIDGRRTNFREKMRKLGYIKAK